MRITCWLTALVTLERCLCLVAHLKVKVIFTPRSSAISAAIIFAFFLLTQTLSFSRKQLQWKFDAVKNRSVFGVVPTSLFEPLRNVSIVMNFTLQFLSLFVILVSNLTLVIFLNKRVTRRNVMSDPTATQRGSNFGNESRSRFCCTTKATLRADVPVSRTIVPRCSVDVIRRRGELGMASIAPTVSEQALPLSTPKMGMASIAPTVSEQALPLSTPRSGMASIAPTVSEQTLPLSTPRSGMASIAPTVSEQTLPLSKPRLGVASIAPTVSEQALPLSTPRSGVAFIAPTVSEQALPLFTPRSSMASIAPTVSDSEQALPLPTPRLGMASIAPTVSEQALPLSTPRLGVASIELTDSGQALPLSTPKLGVASIAPTDSEQALPLSMPRLGVAFIAPTDSEQSLPLPQTLMECLPSTSGSVSNSSHMNHSSTNVKTASSPAILTQTTRNIVPGAETSAEVAAKRDRKRCRMILLLSAIMIVSFLPNTICLALTMKYEEFRLGKSLSNSFIVAYSVTFLVESTCASVNIVLYYTMSINYRRALRKITLGCRRGTRRVADLEIHQ